MAKKILKENEVTPEQFLFTTTGGTELEPTPAPEANKLNPEVKQAEQESSKRDGRELKSRRVQLLIQPTIYAELQEAALDNDLSVNQYIVKAIKEALKNEG